MSVIEAAGEPATADTPSTQPVPARPIVSFRRAYLMARFGYWLVPACAGLLVAIPLAVVGSRMLAQHRLMAAGDAWVLVGLLPAALLILASWVRFERP